MRPGAAQLLRGRVRVAVEFHHHHREAIFFLLALHWTAAEANWRIGIGIGVPVCYPPYPYRAYVAPAPVKVQPYPVYVQPAPVSVPSATR